MKCSVVLLLVLAIFMALPNSALAATEKNTKEYVTNVVCNASVEGPEIVVDLGEYGTTTLKKDVSGGYSGEIKVQSAGMIAPTIIKCTLSPRAGGVETLHHIIISWTGGNQVNMIRANSLMIRKSSLTSTKIYYNKPFSRSGGSKTTGSITLGTVTIPKSVKKVYVSTTGLQCYFNNRDYWISLTELRGWAQTNW